MKKVFLLLGRICLSLIFVSSALGKVLSWDETVQYMSAALSRWTSGMVVHDMTAQMFSFMQTYTALLLVFATLLEGVGGLLVLLGYKIRLGSILLILFLIPVTTIMHPFWLETGPDKTLQMILFMKNLSILGGLMIVAAHGEESEEKKLF